MIFIFNILYLALLSTLIPLIIGALLAFLLKKKTKYLPFVLYISAGTIFGLICFDLFKEIIELGLNTFSYIGILYFILIILFTLSSMFFLHLGLEKLLNRKSKHDEEHNHMHDHAHIETFIDNSKDSYLKAGIFLLLALLFHNFPEGISLGVIYKNNVAEGISLASFLSLHNLIMGISIALPLIMSEMKKRNIILLVILSFVPSLIGTMLGYYLSGISSILEFIILSISCGILLFVIYEELTPKVHVKNNKLISFALFLIGFIISLVLHFII